MVTRKEFLALVLPPLTGAEQYCTIGIKTGQGQQGRDEVKQEFVGSIDEISVRSDALGAGGYNVFYAVAKYGDSKAGRTTNNAVALKSFYIDLDCGLGKPYVDLAEGITALKSFCKAAALPRPTIVKSGLGAHVYWVLDQPMPRAEWKRHADALKGLCTTHGFNVDPAVTGEAARVLRVPETMHVKDPTNPILVEVLHVAPVLSTDDVERLFPVDTSLDVLEGHAGRFRAELDPVTRALLGNQQSRFKTILEKSGNGNGCAQIIHIATKQEEIEEPLWRAGLSIAQCCVDRDKAIHAISNKHSTYSREETEKKANATKGPYTCSTFKRLNPSLCDNCPHTLTSPIQLGSEVAEASEADNVVTGIEHATKEVRVYEIPKYPFPFFRGKTGGVYIHTKKKKDKKGKGDDDDDEEDVDELIYPYDLYVVKRMTDPDAGETLLVRLHLPVDGVREFILPLASALSKEKFVAIAAHHGVTALGKRQDSLMHYITKWVETLQATTEAEMSHRQFGWLPHESGIIVGDKEIRATEIVYSPPSASTLQLTPWLQPRGDFHVWKDVINTYGRPGMEPRAFAFFMAFGTLLMRFTSLDGFLLNLIFKESGTGKSTVLHAINSVYGRPKDLILLQKDTDKSRWQRVGTMQNLCVTYDEITNMESKEMSNMSYGITSGRAGNRLQRDKNAERTNDTQWQTGMVTSSNRSIYDALLSLKALPDGEMKRVMEIFMAPDPLNDPAWSRAHFDRMYSNYGHAILPYAQALVAQTSAVKHQLESVRTKVDNAANISTSERFWEMMVSISVTGGAIAKQLNLHDIPIKPVFEYGVNLIKNTRTRARDHTFDTDDFLGGFLQRHYHETLVINGQKDKRTGLEHAAIREPRGALLIRYEPDTKLLFIATRAYRDDCVKLQMPFEESLAPYKKAGAFLGMKKKRMTAGTYASTEAPVNALHFDTTKLDCFNEGLLLKPDTDGEGDGASPPNR